MSCGKDTRVSVECDEFDNPERWISWRREATKMFQSSTHYLGRFFRARSTRSRALSPTEEVSTSFSKFSLSRCVLSLMLREDFSWKCFQPNIFCRARAGTCAEDSDFLGWFLSRRKKSVFIHRPLSQQVLISHLFFVACQNWRNVAKNDIKSESESTRVKFGDA